MRRSGMSCWSWSRCEAGWGRPSMLTAEAWVSFEIFGSRTTPFFLYVNPMCKCNPFQALYVSLFLSLSLESQERSLYHPKFHVPNFPESPSIIYYYFLLLWVLHSKPTPNISTASLFSLWRFQVSNGDWILFMDFAKRNFRLILCWHIFYLEIFSCLADEGPSRHYNILDIPYGLIEP